MITECRDIKLAETAARAAVRLNLSRDRFMSLAKKAWYAAAIDAGDGRRLRDPSAEQLLENMVAVMGRQQPQP